MPMTTELDVEFVEPTAEEIEQQADDSDDDYWAPEPIKNEAVAEWWAQQPESRRRYSCGLTGGDCPTDIEKTKECPSC